MTETRPTEAEHSTEVHSHNGVEVFDTNSSPSIDNSATKSATGDRFSGVNHDTAFDSATLPMGNALAGDQLAGNFRTTDLHNSEISNVNRTDMGATNGVTSQGTNWSTILTLIVAVFAIILIISWIF